MGVPPFIPQTVRSNNFNALPLVPPPPGCERVHMCEWRTLQGKLIIEGAMDCIAVAALNTIGRTALGSHFYPDDFNTDPSFIDSAIDAIPSLGPSDATKIAIRGGKKDIRDERFSLKRREYITQHVTQIALAHAIPQESISIIWLDDSPEEYDQWVDIYIDPAVGQIKLVTTIEEAAEDAIGISETVTL